MQRTILQGHNSIQHRRQPQVTHFTWLSQAKRDHGCNLGVLVPALQRLLCYGLHRPPTSPLRCAAGAPSMQRAAQPQQQARANGAALTSGSAAAEHVLGSSEAQGSLAPTTAPPAAEAGRPSSYIPPHLRRASGEAAGAASRRTSAASEAAQVPPAPPTGSGRQVWGRAAAPAAGGSAPSSPLKQQQHQHPGQRLGAIATGSGEAGHRSAASRRRSTQSVLESSDSELSDSEGAGGGEVRRGLLLLRGLLAAALFVEKNVPRGLGSSALHAECWLVHTGMRQLTWRSVYLH